MIYVRGNVGYGMYVSRTYHDQKQILLIMETPPKFDYKWISALRCHTAQHGLFCKRMLKFLVREYMSLSDCLKSIQVRAAFVAYKEDFSRTSFAEHTHHFKVGHLHFARDTILGARCGLGTLLTFAALARGIEWRVIFSCGG